MTRYFNFTVQAKRLATLTTTALLLSGCHFTVTDVHEHEASYDTEVTHSLTRYDTVFLIRTALVPYSLSATGINMIADPAAYLTPSERMTIRGHVPVETTSTYLFDSGTCDYGGNTTIDARGETATYDNNTTFLSMDVTANASDCRTRNWQGNVTLNSQLQFAATGWYDDYYDRIDSLDSKMTGRLHMQADNSDLDYTNIDSEMIELTSIDFKIEATANLWLNDGWLKTSAALTTIRGVHWYKNDTRPHAGKVRIKGYRGWVELEFSDTHISRTDSNGYRDSIAWSSLSYG